MNLPVFAIGLSGLKAGKKDALMNKLFYKRVIASIFGGSFPKRAYLPSNVAMRPDDVESVNKYANTNFVLQTTNELASAISAEIIENHFVPRAREISGKSADERVKIGMIYPIGAVDIVHDLISEPRREYSLSRLGDDQRVQDVAEARMNGNWNIEYTTFRIQRPQSDTKLLGRRKHRVEVPAAW